MADLSPMGFNPSEVEDMGDGFSIVPPGIYSVVIADSKLADTKAGTGKVLELHCQIIEGPQTGTIIIDRLNIKNPSDKAQKIGQSQLKNVCDAVGFVGQLADSAALHGKPYSVKVEVENFKSNTTGKDLQSNKVAKRMKKQAPATHTAPPPAAGQGAAAADSWG